MMNDIIIFIIDNLFIFITLFDETDILEVVETAEVIK